MQQNEMERELITESDFECWIINKNAQYRIQSQKQDDEIEFSFWVPDGGVEKFKTSYRKLIEIMRYASGNLCETKY